MNPAASSVGRFRPRLTLQTLESRGGHNAVRAGWVDARWVEIGWVEIGVVEGGRVDEPGRPRIPAAGLIEI